MNERLHVRLRAADPAEVDAALREAASRLHVQAAETDAETAAATCDLADELADAPECVGWPELLALLRELAPDGAEALGGCR